MLWFDDNYYQEVIHKHNYNLMDFNPIDFDLNDVSTKVLRYKWLCYYHGNDFAKALHENQRCIVTTEIGLSGTPHQEINHLTLCLKERYSMRSLSNV